MIEELKQALVRAQAEWRYRQLGYELEQAQADCAALGAYIGRIIKERQELEQEMSHG